MQSPSLINRIDQWFFKPSSAGVFTFFRIAVAIFCAVQMIKLYPDLLNIFGEYGFNRADVVAVIQADFMPRLSWLSSPLGNWGISEIQVIFGLFYFYLAILLVLALGYLPRITALLAFIIHLMFFGSGKMFMYGVDYFTTSALFYTLILPKTQTFSLRSFRFSKATGKNAYATFLRRLIQIHLCLVYFFGGFSKTLGVHWWTGDGIWRAVSLPGFSNLEMSWISNFPTMIMVLGWGVLFLETFYFRLIYIKKIRPYVLLAIMGMHAGIGIAMGLFQFATIMILFNLTAFGWKYLVRIFNSSRIDQLAAQLLRSSPSGEKPPAPGHYRHGNTHRIRSNPESMGHLGTGQSDH